MVNLQNENEEETEDDFHRSLTFHRSIRSKSLEMNRSERIRSYWRSFRLIEHFRRSFQFDRVDELKSSMNFSFCTWTKDEINHWNRWKLLMNKSVTINKTIESEFFSSFFEFIFVFLLDSSRLFQKSSHKKSVEESTCCCCWYFSMALTNRTIVDVVRLIFFRWTMKRQTNTKRIFKSGEEC